MNLKTAGLAATLVTLAGATSALGQISVGAPETLLGIGNIPASGARTGANTVVSVTLTGGALNNGDNVTFAYDIVAIDATNNLIELQSDQPIPAAALDGTGAAAPDGAFGDAVVDQGANYNVDINFAVVPTFAAQIASAAATIANDPNLVSVVVRIEATDAVPTTVGTSITPGVAGAINEAATESPAIDNAPLALVTAAFDDNNTPADLTDDFLYLTFNRPLFLNNAGETGNNPGANLGNGTVDAVDAANRPGLNSLVPADIAVIINGGTVANNATFPADAADFVFGSNQTVRINLATSGNLVPNTTQTTAVSIAGTGNLVDYLRNDANGLQANVADVTNDGLVITGVEALQEVIFVDGAPVAGAIRVTYNLPLATAGDVPFYNGPNGGLVNIDNGVTSLTDLVVTAAVLDPQNPNAVLLSVQDQPSPNDPNEIFQLYADARSFSNDPSTGEGSILQLDVGGGVAPTTPAFNSGAAAFNDAGPSTITDSIPSLVDVFGFGDLDGDGSIDAALFIFSEPVTTTNTTADLQLRAGDGIVNPFAQITAAGGLVQDTVAFSTTDIALTGLTNVTAGFQPDFGAYYAANPGVTAAYPPRLVSNGTNGNTIAVTFDPTTVDWDGDGLVGAADATEATPGTGGGVGGASILIGAWNALTLNFNDTAGNTATLFGQTFPVAAGGPEQAFAFDRANPIPSTALFFTGDNQVAGNNQQFWREILQGGATPLANVPGANAASNAAVGDQFANNRAATFWSEPLNNALPAFPFAGATAIQTFGNEANLIVDDLAGVFANSPIGAVNVAGLTSFGGAPNNITFQFNGSAGEQDGQLVPGSLLTIPTSVGVTDTPSPAGTPGNIGTGVDITVNDAVAPYVPFFANADNTAGGFPTVGWQAFLEDNDGDAFADQIRLNFSQTLSQAALDTDATGGFADFTVTGTTINSVNTPSGGDEDVVIIGINDGDISIGGNAQVIYNSSTTFTIVGVNGFSPADLAVPAADLAAALLAAAPVAPNVDGFTPAIMTISGTATNNGVPLPVGTKIFGTVAIPTVVQLDFTWNDIDFEFDLWEGDDFNAAPSMKAFTDALLGIEKELYLQRGAGNNFQFVNEINAAAAVDDVSGNGVADTDGAGFLELNEDLTNVEINARNLNRVTFRGNGQDGAQRLKNRLRNGQATLAWDVMRSANGSYAFFADGDNGGGFFFGGNPVLSREVITTADGAFTINVTGPTNAFNNGSVLSTLGFPVILVAELPNGQRFALSSLLSSANASLNADGVGFAPIFFDAEVETSDQSVNGDNAADGASTFNFDLANVNVNQVFNGWNLLSYGQDNGWATSNSNIPNTLTAGLADADADGTPDNIYVGTLPAAGALEQFTYWLDRNPAGALPDGIWTVADDAVGAAPPAGASRELDSIVLDLGQFNVFAFTMTDRGVQFGDGITSFVGGYAAGVFVTPVGPLSAGNAGLNGGIGVFQFGPDLNDATTVGNAIVNNSTTLGWSLVTVTNADSNGDLAADSAADFFATNANLDYFITLLNQGPSTTASESILINSASTGGIASPNDLPNLVDNTAGFTHVAPN